MASVVAFGQMVSPVVLVLVSIFRVLNKIANSPKPSQVYSIFTVHFVYGWLGHYIKAYNPVWQGTNGPKKMNLTAVKEETEVMGRHVEDSLAIIEPVRNAFLLHCGSSFEKLSVVDVGSGAGLPGLILAIACPGWKVTLLESMNKRCIFLEHVVSLIGLQNVRIVRDRAENLGQNLDFREGFDIAVARAVAEMRVLAEYCLPLVRVGGLFVAAKGHDPQEEVTKAERAIHLMGASLLQTCFVESHSKYGQRTAIICLKDGPTPRKYPRAPGTPSKLPL
ncbi:hypothetical protein DH2020_019351 [Rehmannia glutinosa]|uniref:Ribosomal RNA small subunit methyltransferase G n=1 Tax=Rehmannia glutinosa TaxID=99300 RepID=A0ABR0WQ18_REHGL